MSGWVGDGHHGHVGRWARHWGGRVGGCVDESMDGWMDVDGCMDRWADATDEPIDRNTELWACLTLQKAY